MGYAKFDFHFIDGCFPWAKFVGFANTGHTIASMWLQSLCSGGIQADATVVTLKHLLRVACRLRLNSLVGQLCALAANLVQTNFGDQSQAVKRKEPLDDQRPVHFKPRLWADLVEYGGLDVKLGQYVHNAVEESTKHDTLSISVDKANPARAVVSNGFICYPNNVGVLCCPGVARANRRSHAAYRAHTGPIGCPMGVITETRCSG
jgi:hypothetical protein